MISIIKLLVFSCFLNSYTSCDFITLHTSPPPDQSCRKTSAVCKLDAKKLNASFKPGATGPTGSKGDKGEAGVKGPPGVDGLNGSDGAPGLKGELGDPGNDGFPGAIGNKGHIGNQGPKGQSGKDGEQGEKGIAGLKGFQGDAGKPGSSGSCINCPFEDLVSSLIDEGDGLEWGAIQKPATKTCRDAPDSERVKIIDIYALYMDSLIVTCDFTTDMTCPSFDDKQNNDNLTIYYNESNPFWLSEKITFKNIYNLEYDQVNWLQQESYRANLTMRYHCLNSKPIAKDGNGSTALLTWNDLTIGPEPTATTAYHYTVLQDGCSSAPKDTWSYTDIELVSPLAERLPIIDFLIKDVGKEKQALKIEIKQLCFG